MSPDIREVRVTLRRSDHFEGVVELDVRVLRRGEPTAIASRQCTSDAIASDFESWLDRAVKYSCEEIKKIALMREVKPCSS